MKRLLTALVSCNVLLAGVGIADEHEGEAGETNVATPVELFACKYNEGKGPADLDAATKKWNAWADKHGVDDYSAWTLVPYYSGPDQDFDVLWLGGSDNARALGRAQDTWLATGSKEAEGFAEVVSCDAHSAYAVLQMNTPAKRDNPPKVVISFSANAGDDLFNPGGRHWPKNIPDFWRGVVSVGVRAYRAARARSHGC